MKNMFAFGGMSDSVKGALLMGSGIVLLLHTIGILQRLFGFILILISLILIVVGFMQAGGVQAVKKVAKKEEKKKKKENKGPAQGS